MSELNLLRSGRKRNILLILAFSLLAMAVMGYHPGLEDDGVYLTAVKSDLNPALYPHDAPFFRVQLQATLFDKWVADFIHFTHLPVSVSELLFQFVSILLIVLGCWSIAKLLFEDERAQWAGVALTAAMMTLPVAGTALNLADQHLHPRNVATAFALLAVSRIMAGKRWQAVPLLLLAFLCTRSWPAPRHLVLFFPDHRDAGTGACLAAFTTRFAGRGRAPWLDF